MKGFFTKKAVNKSNSKVDNQDPCEKCGLYKTCITPKATYTGDGQRGVFLIAEAPGRQEDEGNREFAAGTQLIGDAGQLLRSKLEGFGLDLERDFWKMNAVNCRPPSNRKPTRKEVKCCRSRVEEALKETRPKFIWLMGGAAIESFYAGKFSNLSVARWRNMAIPDREWNAWILPMYHPSFLFRTRKKTKRGFVYYDANTESVFDRDLSFAYNCLSKKHPKFYDFENDVELVTDINELIDRFDLILSRREVITTAFDIETTSLKPFPPLQKIWSMAIAYKGKAFAYPISYPYWEPQELEDVITLTKQYLENPRIRKIAHNLKFEDVWCRSIFDIEVKGWKWCSQNAAHIIDDRKKFTGLKFQSYIRYSVYGYENEVKKYMKTDPKTGLNRLSEVPLEDLLLYNGLDALLTLKLGEAQQRIIPKNSKRREAYNLTHGGLLAFADSQMRGIPVDSLYYTETEKELVKKTDRLETMLQISKEARMFKDKYKKDINLTSITDLRKLFSKVLKVKLEKKTTTGLDSMDAEVMNTLDIPFARRLVKLRKLKKIKDTYLAQFTREITFDKIHPFIDLHTTRTNRSSSSGPNFQNIPIREEEAKKAIRLGIIPYPGCQFLCIDYGSQEVRIIACYTKDPNLVAYIEDESTDMHRDQAAEIFVLNKKQMDKTLRFYTKNQFVFPEFYGSYYVSCARNLWQHCADLETGEGIPVWEHLKNEGVISSKLDFDSFTEHIKTVEEKFWDKFPHVREWQERRIKEYQSKGYVDTFFGYRRYGLLTHNMIINTPIQATAFHCLLWSYIQLNKYSKQHWNSRILAQIHDELIYNLYPEERREVIEKSVDIMENEIREVYDFITVPLKAEVEITPIDKSWFYKEPYKEGKNE